VSGFNSCSWSHGTNIPSTAALYLGGEWGRLSTDQSRFRPPANVPVRANSDHDWRSTTAMWPSPRRWLLAHTTAKLPATHSASVSAALRRRQRRLLPPSRGRRRAGEKREREGERLG
jgi:hypothetical protein